jgi:hypothetical protein
VVRARSFASRARWRCSVIVAGGQELQRHGHHRVVCLPVAAVAAALAQGRRRLRVPRAGVRGRGAMAVPLAHASGGGSFLGGAHAWRSELHGSRAREEEPRNTGRRRESVHAHVLGLTALELAVALRALTTDWLSPVRVSAKWKPITAVARARGIKVQVPPSGLGPRHGTTHRTPRARAAAPPCARPDATTHTPSSSHTTVAQHQRPSRQ